ncbi:hypothetical protein QYM36_009731 [Artemia franciscana]|nr:hypothetical protein QYM36_009731 [Artemia franciscana]
MKPLETAEENVKRLTGNPDYTLPHPEYSNTDKNLHTYCPDCRIRYCSRLCFDKAYDSYHKVLCLRSSILDPDNPLVILNESWKQMHYPPETATVMLIARILAILKQHPSKAEIRSTLKIFCQKTVEEEAALAHKLLGDKFADQLSTLNNLFCVAFPDPELQEFLQPDAFRSLLALIGRNAQGIGTSPFYQWRTAIEESDLPEKEKKQLDKTIDQIYEDIDQVSGTFLNTEGSGLYLKQSAANHSCIPSARVTFPQNNHVLSLVASRAIKKGEEIFISYLDECELSRSKTSRQQALRENYLFNCNCERCEFGDSGESSSDSGDDDEEMSD